MERGKRRSLRTQAAPLAGVPHDQPSPLARAGSETSDYDPGMPALSSRSESISPTPTEGTSISSGRPSPVGNGSGAQPRLRRPMNSFLLFSNEHRTSAVEKCPTFVGRPCLGPSSDAPIPTPIVRVPCTPLHSPPRHPRCARRAHGRRSFVGLNARRTRSQASTSKLCTTLDTQAPRSPRPTRSCACCMSRVPPARERLPRGPRAAARAPFLDCPEYCVLQQASMHVGLQDERRRVGAARGAVEGAALVGACGVRRGRQEDQGRLQGRTPGVRHSPFGPNPGGCTCACTFHLSATELGCRLTQVPVRSYHSDQGQEAQAGASARAASDWGAPLHLQHPLPSYAIYQRAHPLTTEASPPAVRRAGGPLAARPCARRRQSRVAHRARAAPRLLRARHGDRRPRRGLAQPHHQHRERQRPGAARVALELALNARPALRRRRRCVGPPLGNGPSALLPFHPPPPPRCVGRRATRAFRSLALLKAKVLAVCA